MLHFLLGLAVGILVTFILLLVVGAIVDKKKQKKEIN